MNCESFTGLLKFVLGNRIIKLVLPRSRDVNVGSFILNFMYGSFF